MGNVFIGFGNFSLFLGKKIKNTWYKNFQKICIEKIIATQKPVYKEEKNIPEFLHRIRPVLSTISEDYEIVFSLDPSPDRTEEVLLDARPRDGRNQPLRFPRRFGR